MGVYGVLAVLRARGRHGTSGELEERGDSRLRALPMEDAPYLRVVSTGRSRKQHGREPTTRSIY